jgi:hypothetical protein
VEEEVRAPGRANLQPTIRSMRFSVTRNAREDSENRGWAYRDYMENVPIGNFTGCGGDGPPEFARGGESRHSLETPEEIDLEKEEEERGRRRRERKRTAESRCTLDPPRICRGQ